MINPILALKNCLGPVTTVLAVEKDFGFFSLQIFPRASQHLPGEREVFIASMHLPVILESTAQFGEDSRQRFVFALPGQSIILLI